MSKLYGYLGLAIAGALILQVDVQESWAARDALTPQKPDQGPLDLPPAPAWTFLGTSSSTATEVTIGNTIEGPDLRGIAPHALERDRRIAFDPSRQAPASHIRYLSSVSRSELGKTSGGWTTSGTGSFD